MERTAHAQHCGRIVFWRRLVRCVCSISSNI